MINSRILSLKNTIYLHLNSILFNQQLYVINIYREYCCTVCTQCSERNGYRYPVIMGNGYPVIMGKVALLVVLNAQLCS